MFGWVATLAFVDRGSGLVGRSSGSRCVGVRAEVALTSLYMIYTLGMSTTAEAPQAAPKRRKLRERRPYDPTPLPIDKGITPPPLNKKQMKYFFEQMEVGDSIFVATLVERESLRAAAHHYNKVSPNGFVHRIVQTDPVYDPRGKGWRLFRVL